ncbi:MAG: ATP-binding protein [Polyangiaceae bacterium]
MTAIRRLRRVSIGHRVFDLFTQGERGLDRRGSGLGVGLAVAKEFVKKHGGSIAIAGGTLEID